MPLNHHPAADGLVPEHTLTFGPFRLETSQGRLWRQDDVIPLRPRSLAMLQYLAEHPGRLITKAELLQQVWEGAHVSDSVLRASAHDIRRALSDAADAPQYLETVGRQGYRFLQGGLGLAQQAVGPVVGRQGDIDQILERFGRAAGGERQLLLLSGEPGIGKTTVVNLFLERLASREGLRVAQGQCIVHYGDGEAYQPLLEALGRLGQGPEGAEVRDVLQRYAPMWLVQLPALVNGAELERLQRQVQGATPARMVRELSEALEVLAAETPLILVLEDLHWSDLSTVEFLAAIAQRRETARLLVLGTYRPADAAVHAQAFRDVVQELRGRGQCDELSIELLSSDDVSAYVAGRLGSSVAAPVAQMIYQRSEGNPLFMANLIDHLLQQQMLIQRDSEWTLAEEMQDTVATIPEGLRPFIMRRLEALSQKERRALEVASVGGIEFAAVAVATALQQPVDEMEAIYESLAVQGRFIMTSELAQWPDGTLSGRYRFQHALYHQILYEQVGPARRAQLHLRLGDRLEAGYGERAHEIAAELAMHFERGRDVGRTVKYLQYAGTSAQQRNAHREAIAHFTKGLTMLPTLPDLSEPASQELELLIALGASLTLTKGWPTTEVGELYRRAQAICRHLGETPHVFPVLWGLWHFHAVRAELQQALELGEELLALAQRVQNSAYDLGAHFMLGGALLGLGKLTPAQAHWDQALDIYDRRQYHHLVDQFGVDPRVFSLSLASHTLWLLGYADQARMKSQAAVALAQDLSCVSSQALARCYAAMLHQYCQDVSATQQQAEAAITLCGEQGFAYYLAWAKIMQSWVQVTQSGREDDLTQMRQGLGDLRATGGRVRSAYYLTLLAGAYGDLGQAEEGLSLLSEARAEVEQTEERFWQAEVYRLTGSLLLKTGADTQAGKAEELFVHALEIARRQHAKSLEIRAATSLSRLWRQQGRSDEARQILVKAYDGFTEGFETADLQQAQFVLRELET